MRFLWLRNWSLRALIFTWLALVALFATTLLWKDNPLHRVSPNADFWVVFVSGLWSVLFPIAYLRDRALAWVQARERRLDAER